VKVSSSVPDGWSARRWLAVVGLVMTAQVVLVFLLSNPASVTPRALPPASRYRLASEGTAPLVPEERPWLVDPAGFALVTRQGFSGKAWVDLPKFRYDIPDWAEPPQWLPMETARLAQPPPPLTPPVSGALLATRPLPVFSAPTNGTRLIVTNSWWRVEGDLASRALQTPVNAPVWPFGQLLNPSVVLCSVTPEGWVFSCIILGSSGLPQADQSALEQVRNARFAALPAPPSGMGLQWGRFVFHWLAAPPGAPQPAPKP
jgi:TonB family protein